MGIPERSMSHSTFNLDSFSEIGSNTTVLVPVIIPSVRFAWILSCSGKIVTNWLLVLFWGPALIVTSLSMILPILFMFFMSLNVAIFYSSSTFEKILHTLSGGAVISRVTLIVLAKTSGRVTIANVISMNIIAIICGCSLILFKYLFMHFPIINIEDLN